ncbi:MAG TPA: hypothetical protein VNI55_06260 [Gaiellaceae bacterium]|nr:hypothetical protein [Gaiellaceae bacterium]
MKPAVLLGFVLVDESVADSSLLRPSTHLVNVAGRRLEFDPGDLQVISVQVGEVLATHHCRVQPTPVDSVLLLESRLEDELDRGRRQLCPL